MMAVAMGLQSESQTLRKKLGKLAGRTIEQAVLLLDERAKKDPQKKATKKKKQKKKKPNSNKKSSKIGAKLAKNTVGQ